MAGVNGLLFTQFLSVRMFDWWMLTGCPKACWLPHIKMRQPMHRYRIILYTGLDISMNRVWHAQFVFCNI